MGHVVNPLLFRLNYSIYWESSFITKKKNAGFITYSNYLLLKFIKLYFQNYNWVDDYFLYWNKFKIVFYNKKINIFIYEHKFSFYRINHFKSLKFVKFFFKQLLLKKYFYFFKNTGAMFFFNQKNSLLEQFNIFFKINIGLKLFRFTKKKLIRNLKKKKQLLKKNVNEHFSFKKYHFIYNFFNNKFFYKRYILKKNYYKFKFKYYSHKIFYKKNIFYPKIYLNNFFYFNYFRKPTFFSLFLFKNKKYKYLPTKSKILKTFKIKKEKLSESRFFKFIRFNRFRFFNDTFFFRKNNKQKNNFFKLKLYVCNKKILKKNIFIPVRTKMKKVHLIKKNKFLIKKKSFLIFFRQYKRKKLAKLRLKKNKYYLWLLNSKAVKFINKKFIFFPVQKLFKIKKFGFKRFPYKKRVKQNLKFKRYTSAQKTKKTKKKINFFKIGQILYRFINCLYLNINFLFFFTIKKDILNSLMFVYNYKLNIFLYFIFRSKFSLNDISHILSSYHIVQYLTLRLLQRYRFIEVLVPLIRFLRKQMSNKFLGGYAILFMGRFNRKDRAMYSWKKRGIFPRSNRLTFIDYENKQVILKFSKCSFKINLIFNTKYKNKKWK